MRMSKVSFISSSRAYCKILGCFMVVIYVKLTSWVNGTDVETQYLHPFVMIKGSIYWTRHSTYDDFKILER